MPLYSYIATDGQGADQLGVVQASNERDLRDELQKRGLSLVSFNLASANQTDMVEQYFWSFLHLLMVLLSFPIVVVGNLIGRIIDKNSAYDEPASKSRELQRKINDQIKVNGKVFLALTLAVLGAGLVLQIMFGRTNPFYITSESKTLRGKLRHIVVGSSTRGDVQKLLADVPEVSDPSSPNKTRYKLNDKGIFSVGYDSTGGDFGYANKVVSKEYSAVPPPVVSTATAVAAPLPRP